MTSGLISRLQVFCGREFHLGRSPQRYPDTACFSSPMRVSSSPAATYPLCEHGAPKGRRSELLALLFQSLEQLRAAHAALEAEYLQACRERHPNPKLNASSSSPRTLSLCRELEAEIYQLGQHLEELQNHTDQTQREPKSCRPDLQDSTPAMPFLSWPAHLPMPSGPVSLPAVHTNHEVSHT